MTEHPTNQAATADDSPRVDYADNDFDLTGRDDDLAGPYSTDDATVPGTDRALEPTRADGPDDTPTTYVDSDRSDS